MAQYRQTYFISDLHLEENRPDITQQFLQFLEKISAMGDALYILGDLFEIWIGDDDESPFHRTIIHAIKSATNKGLPIYFLRGNRDFLIGKSFLQATGCRLLADEEKIIVYGTPILLMHGDTLCTRDVAYVKARKLARNRLLQTVFLYLPLKVRRTMADKMRAKSTLHTQSTALDMMDVTEEAVIRVMRKHAVNWLIHGHTHRPATHEFLLETESATRIVLGAWHEKGNALVCDESGKKAWVVF